jgi:hypothetical protein
VLHELGQVAGKVVACEVCAPLNFNCEFVRDIAGPTFASV